LRYGVWSGPDSDLELLVPKLRLLTLDLIMQNRLLMRQFQPLLAELQHPDCEYQTAPEAQEKLDHDR
jgi:hypothetical protein